MLDARRALAVTVALLAVAGFATAGTLTVEGAGGLSVDITCDLPPSESVSPEVSGPISIAPVTQSLHDQPMMLFVDGMARGLTGEGGGPFQLDTAKLAAGEHTFRVDAVSGEELIASTGSVPFMVLSATEAATRQTAADLGGERPAFIKLYRPRVFRELVYFNNREGDLERHAIMRGGRIYITLVDLMRHIGGTVIWGPNDGNMQVERNGVTVRLSANSSVVRVNGASRAMDASTVRINNRTYVPVRPFAALFGIATTWDTQDDRAYVTYQE